MESSSSDKGLIQPADVDIDLGDEKYDLNSSVEEKGKENFNEIRSGEIGNSCDRPTSLRLESVLEYTNRIKTFLGFQDEEREPEESSSGDSKKSAENTLQENNSDKELFMDKNFNDENSHLNDENISTMNKKLNHSVSTCNPLPDIIGVQSDYLKETDLEQLPDVLELSKNLKTERPEAFTENSDKNADIIRENSVRSDLFDLEKNIIGEVFLKNKADAEGEPFPNSERKSEIISGDVVNYDVSGVSKDKDEKVVIQNNYSASFPCTTQKENENESEALRTKQKNGQINCMADSEKIQNEEDFEDEKPYQITHIEEGLRQTEGGSKSIHPQKLDEPNMVFSDLSLEADEQHTRTKDLSQKADEQQAMSKKFLHELDNAEQNDLNDANPSTSLERNSDWSMEDIRRVSAEVVSSVLQTAGNEIEVIFKNHDPTTEEDIAIKPESLDGQEVILPLQDTEMEIHAEINSLAGLPKEKSNRTFSNTTDISRESVATSTETKNIPVGSKHSIDRIEVTDEIDFDTQCGIGPFKPHCIQRYATANVYVILYSIIGILHGSYYTYLVGVLTTLEKRFEFKSKTSGFIMMLDELTPLFLGVLVGHFGGRAHRPRLLSFGMFLSSFCCFASALPYFLYGTATHLSSMGNLHNKTSAALCNGDARLEHCDDDDRPPTVTAICLLMLGSFLKGFGNLAYYAIGLAYLDDNAKKRNTPLYFAIAFALRLLGPMVGFLMSSAFLKYYENPLESPDFGPDDPRWIGGWWMGFFLQGILLLIFAGPMALFPRRLPDHRSLVHVKEHDSNIKMFDGLGDSLKRLARNPLYMLIGLNAIFTVYGNFGYYIMLPKYMENQFRLSASSASLYAGPPGIAALMVSCIVGGYLIWKFKPTAKFLAGGLVTLELISTLGYLILMIPRCEEIQMTHFGFGEESLVLESACNSNCSCSTVQFTPVCGPDGKSYFSPCYAGCQFQKEQSFYNCSCLDSADAVVTKGLCTSENCWSQAFAYIVTLPVLQFIVNILRVAYTMIMLRSIKPEDKNIALGVFETVLSTVAFIPFPVLYGALVDSACLVWEKSCGESGNCWLYDIQKFNYLMHGGSAFFCGLSTLNLVAIFFLVNRIKDLYKDEDEDV